MSHEILGNRFITRLVPAWHELGTVFPEEREITARQAMEEVAGDIQVVKCPITFELDGVQIQDPERSAVVRRPIDDDPEPRVLGVTREKWVAASYADLAGALDELSKTHRVETAGVLKQGGLAFECFRAPDWDVRGDEMRSYFAASFSLTPGVGHKVWHSPVRVVCWNTLTMSEGQSTIKLSMQHTEGAVGDIKLAGDLVAKFRAAQDHTRLIFEGFADRVVTDEEAEAIFNAAFPDPPLPARLRLIKETLSDAESVVFRGGITPETLEALEKSQQQYDAGCARAAELREAARECYAKFEPAAKRGTLWAAYNAVTEVADWREGRGAAESAVIGSRAKEKERGFQAAFDLMRAVATA